ncbi:Hint domain-containing protein [Pseudothioclava arenosa]|uniref:Hedgehog/Intein (Hint) domain-containing protein n=1 Tax=Pseudothioclava arenosa TaxID=1795308 RepID=A0A2A4CNT8_9RHOB|nr:Hint domain-containing protein [Pseudothioclava arenosa]PCD76127.1 hypothetical protein CLN94_09840 [Pseudothioclava arenosa]
MFGLKLQDFWTARKSPVEGALAADALVESYAEALPSDGIVAGTRIATEAGWRPVEALAPGDRVMTFDHGVQEVLHIERIRLGAVPRAILVPQQALGNATALLLLGDQSVMVESNLAEAAFGDPFVLVPSEVLEGFRGIEAVAPDRELEIFRLQFAAPEVVYANGFGLIHCGGGAVAPVEVEAPAYPLLPREAARMVVEALIEEEAATC